MILSRLCTQLCMLKCKRLIYKARGKTKNNIRIISKRFKHIQSAQPIYFETTKDLLTIIVYRNSEDIENYKQLVSKYT